MEILGCILLFVVLWLVFAYMCDDGFGGFITAGVVFMIGSCAFTVNDMPKPPKPVAKYSKGEIVMLVINSDTHGQVLWSDCYNVKTSADCQYSLRLPTGHTDTFREYELTTKEESVIVDQPSTTSLEENREEKIIDNTFNPNRENPYAK